MKVLQIVIRNILSHKMSFYAVASGREVGIFNTWEKCEQQVKGFKGPKYKKFKSLGAAEEYMQLHGAGGSKTECGASVSRKPQFAPQDIAIPLGTKVPVEWTKQITKEEQFVQNFWPTNDDFDEADDDALVAALDEVEGISEVTYSSGKSSLSPSRKRKAPTDYTSTSLQSKIPKHVSKIWEPIGLKKFGVFEFPIDCEGFVIVYTDGSCFNNGQANAVAGFGVYFGEHHPLNAAKPVRGRVSNNAGEIQAAIYAIQVAKDFGIRKLCVSTDSQFLINAVTSWLKVWKRKSWKLKSGGPVKNVDDFKILDDLLDGSIQIKWNYVKGHENIKGNEMADKLARKGSEMYREALRN